MSVHWWPDFHRDAGVRAAGSDALDFSNVHPSPPLLLLILPLALAFHGFTRFVRAGKLLRNSPALPRATVLLPASGKLENTQRTHSAASGARLKQSLCFDLRGTKKDTRVRGPCV